MSDIGLMFNSEMVRALLSGTKSQTRRLNGLEKINENPDDWRLSLELSVWPDAVVFIHKESGEQEIIKCPYAVGDRVYAKEPHAFEKRLDHLTAREIGEAADVSIWFKYAESDLIIDYVVRGRWRSSMFMPKFAARIWREIVGIRCERLQSITPRDACAEGIGDYGRSTPTIVFRKLWDRLSGKKHPWERNPWIWRLSLKEVGNATE